MKIIIPSYKREVVKTLRYIPQHMNENTYVVVQERDKDTIKSLPEGINKVVLPDEVRTIGPTRQWILDNFDGVVVQMDDDLRISELVDARTYNLEACTPLTLMQHLERMEELLEYYPLIGISERAEAHLRYRNHITEVARHSRIHMMDVSWIREIGARFDRGLYTIEDYDFILQVLGSGTANAVYNQLFACDFDSNSDGGCKDIRSEIDLQANCEKFASLHPEGVVKIVMKKTKLPGGDWERPDVRIGWKKAFEAGCENLRFEAML